MIEMLRLIFGASVFCGILLAALIGILVAARQEAVPKAKKTPARRQNVIVVVLTLPDTDEAPSERDVNEEGTT